MFGPAPRAAYALVNAVAVAAVEAGSEHPLAAARERGVPLAASGFRAAVGLGVTVVVDGRPIASSRAPR